jgi:hypothetical protein
MRAIYGLERYDRLAAIKKQYDPRNLFRMNHNITPIRSNNNHTQGSKAPTHVCAARSGSRHGA